MNQALNIQKKAPQIKPRRNTIPNVAMLVDDEPSVFGPDVSDDRLFGDEYGLVLIWASLSQSG